MTATQDHSRSPLSTSLVDEVLRARTLPKPSTAKMIRVAAGVSQKRLGAELGVHRITVARWEDGTRAPRGSIRAAYADLLNQLRELAS
jgi:DNA-binding transcriptional regulator YiaG